MKEAYEVLKLCCVMVALCVAVAAGGCAGPMYAGAPDEMYHSAPPPSYERSYVGGAVASEHAEYEEQPANDAWPQEPQYEYRGGRDPVTGRARTQM